MADPADVVPLRRGGRAPFWEPAAAFPDVTDPARTLNLAWSPDQQAIRFGVEHATGSPAAVVLSAEDLLDLVRVVMDGLPRRGGGNAVLAPVVPLTPRQSQRLTEDP